MPRDSKIKDGTNGNNPYSQRPLTDQELHAHSMQYVSVATLQSQPKHTNADLEISEKYMELGKALKSKGDYQCAVMEMHKALEIRRKVLGKEHPETASTYYQLGVTHLQGQDYEQALTELKRALTLGRIVWGKNEDLDCTYYQIGIVLNAQGDYDRGLRELKKALEIFEATLGKDHEATARTFHHMGDSFAGKNDTTGALVNYGKAFVIQTARLGRHNPQTVETFRKLDLHMRKPND